MGATTSLSTDFSTDFEPLTWAVAEDGPAAHEHELAQVVRAAREAGIALVAADVVADHGASAVARQRAFAHVVAGFALAVTPSAPTLHAVA
jgi:hypothetical protein